MRLFTRTSAVSACLAFLSPGIGLCAGAGQAAGNASVVTPSVQPAAGDPAVPDAAAKHAKRTACIKQAKSRKLLGADRNTFIKQCVAAS